jgi:putative endonuclease
MHGGCFVYILRCADSRYYVRNYRGVDLATRVSEHNSGHFPDAWTHARRPVVLVWSTHFERITDAIAYEAQVKKWSRAKKDALIAGDFDRLKELSKSKSAPADPTKARFPKRQPL